jgi:XTP/dITP diphosphohydrolase
MKLLLATRNAHKITEIRSILEGSGIELETLDDYPDLPELPETGDTFEHNALQKARTAYQLTGVMCAADDSGIEVDALDGRPGVHSKRFSPEGTAEGNNRHLVALLTGRTDRTARYRCVLAVVGDGIEQTADGRCEGVIGHEYQGSGGFGYDPLFWPIEAPGQTMADLSMDEKNAISHRGRAFRQLPSLLARASRIA